MWHVSSLIVSVIYAEGAACDDTPSGHRSSVFPF